MSEVELAHAISVAPATDREPLSDLKAVWQPFFENAGLTSPRFPRTLLDKMINDLVGDFIPPDAESLTIILSTGKEFISKYSWPTFPSVLFLAHVQKTSTPASSNSAANNVVVGKTQIRSGVPFMLDVTEGGATPLSLVSAILDTNLSDNPALYAKGIREPLLDRHGNRLRDLNGKLKRGGRNVYSPERRAVLRFMDLLFDQYVK